LGLPGRVRSALRTIHQACANGPTGPVFRVPPPAPAPVLEKVPLQDRTRSRTHARTTSNIPASAPALAPAALIAPLRITKRIPSGTAQPTLPGDDAENAPSASVAPSMDMPAAKSTSARRVNTTSTRPLALAKRSAAAESALRRSSIVKQPAEPSVSTRASGAAAVAARAVAGGTARISGLPRPKTGPARRAL
jgi:hypothetical protein